MSGRKVMGDALPLVILAGGKGTRLQSVNPTRPKPMVVIHEKPFLHWLVSYYVKLGYSHFILSTGHLASVIEEYPWSKKFNHTQIEFYHEQQPLGTGGATQAIYNHFKDLDAAWVVNGDTLLPQPLPCFDGTVRKSFDALYTALEKTQIFDAKPNLHVQNSFVLAEGQGGNYFDGGAICVTRKAVEKYSGSAPCSIHELLGPSMKEHRVGYAIVPGTCYDIGTPERLQRFEQYVRELKED